MCIKSDIESEFCTVIFIYLGKGSVWETVFRKVKYGWWSDNCLVKIPDLGFIVDLVNLQKKLSIRVQLFLESLVGSLMWG